MIHNQLPPAFEQILQAGLALWTFENIILFNFHHRQPLIYDPYSNVQPLRDFRGSLASHFRVHRYFATSHNWKHSEPSRALLRAAQMPLRLNVPLVSRVLAVEYFFICSSKKGA